MGFGWPVTIISPQGVASTGLVGYSDDIAQAIDPDTGQLVSGRLVSVALRISTLSAQGFALPYGVANTDGKPWVAQFDDINANPYTFKVRQANPDRALGLVVCILEGYDA